MKTLATRRVSYHSIVPLEWNLSLNINLQPMDFLLGVDGVRSQVWLLMRACNSKSIYLFQFGSLTAVEKEVGSLMKDKFKEKYLWLLDNLA